LTSAAARPERVPNKPKNAAVRDNAKRRVNRAENRENDFIEAKSWRLTGLLPDFKQNVPINTVECSNKFHKVNIALYCVTLFLQH